MITKNQDILSIARKRLDDFNKLRQAGLICLDGNFFPSVHYPPITMYPPINEESLFSGYKNPSGEAFDIYAHFPFCITHCVFCHYPVKLGDLTEEKDYYISILEKEMDIYMRRLGIKTIKAGSILVGGGTPTYLEPEQLERFLKFFTSRISLSPSTQFSYDVDPPTLLGEKGKERLKIMRSYGVNRLTIGIQSLNDTALKAMNRPHTTEEAMQSIEDSRKAGFKINTEYIFGFPGQTMDNWIEVMEKAASMGTEEIQLYRLKIVPYGDRVGTILKKYSESSETFPPAEEVIMMKQAAISILSQKGYFENLTRVFTKERNDYSHYTDHQCCKLFDQIGLGLTAFSSLRDRFALNTQDFKEYYSLVENGKLPINRGLIRSKDDQRRWCIILPLKNREVYKKFYQMQTGVSLSEVFRKKIDRLKSYGLLFEDDNILKLTELGRFFADEVCEQFSDPKYIPFPKTAYATDELNPYEDSQP